jgi:hypothetical protein
MARITQQMIFARLWVALVMLWAGLRILAVEIWLVDYGVSIWWFAVIEVLSSVLYGVSSARLVKELATRHRKNSAKWGSLHAHRLCLARYIFVECGQSNALGYIFGCGVVGSGICCDRISAHSRIGDENDARRRGLNLLRRVLR